MGVKEFNVPASALSIPSSATQNRYAGNKLPKTPDIKMMPSVPAGTFLKLIMAEGSSTKPAKTIRNEATWNAVKCSNPSFIMIKLLPQMMERIIKINQFKNPLFNWYKIAAKLMYLS